jgi:hypothetical protein
MKENPMLWDSQPTTVRFSRQGTVFNAVELTLRSNGRKLVIYELSNGLSIMEGPFSPIGNSTRITGSSPTDVNMGFVEALVNPNLRDVTKFARMRQKGATLARQGKLSPETIEVFGVHIPTIRSMLDQSRRKQQVERMKALITDLGDMTEEEVLDIWREARTEEVMKS